MNSRNVNNISSNNFQSFAANFNQESKLANNMKTFLSNTDGPVNSYTEPDNNVNVNNIKGYITEKDGINDLIPSNKKQFLTEPNNNNLINDKNRNIDSDLPNLQQKYN